MSQTNHFMVAEIKRLEKVGDNLSSKESQAECSLETTQKDNNFHSSLEQAQDVNLLFVPRCLSPLQKLQAMKRAFDTNQYIIAAQGKQLTFSSQVVSFLCINTYKLKAYHRSILSLSQCDFLSVLKYVIDLKI